MKRFPILATVALLLLTALPAVVNAQACGGYGQAPCEQPERPEEQDGEVEETTPCSTIVVQGDNWGSGTVVYIDREFDEECPGEGEPDDVLADVEDGSSPSARSASTAARTEATVSDDGTFTATLRVPADAVGDYEVVVSGEDLDGTTKRQTYTYNVDPAANFVSNASSAAAEDGNGPTMALAAILAALILAVGFSWPSLVARIRR